MSVFFAQTDFRPGVVYLLSGDSLVGYINYKGSKYMQAQCVYKSAPDAEIVTYLPQQIIAYKFVNSKYFVSKTIFTDGKKENVFLEFLVKGKMNLYHYKNKKDYDTYFISTDKDSLVELPYEEGYKTQDSRTYLYKSRKHKYILHKYLIDAPSLAPDIEKLNTPDHNALISLAKNYHQKVCSPGEQCIVYVKKQKVPFYVELLMGSVFYSSANFSGRALVHVGAPRTNEKIYFKTGFLYESINIENVRYNVLKHPVQIEYMYPKGMLRPVIGYGVYVYSRPQYDMRAALSLGCFARVNSAINFSVHFTQEFHSYDNFAIIPKDMAAQSAYVGLSFNL